MKLRNPGARLGQGMAAFDLQDGLACVRSLNHGHWTVNRRAMVQRGGKATPGPFPP
jgi:hypothetical protein